MALVAMRILGRSSRPQSLFFFNRSPNLFCSVAGWQDTGSMEGITPAVDRQEINRWPFSKLNRTAVE
jgi:hypothetical protein